MIDLIQLQVEKGGDPEVVRESQRRRGASVELIDEVLALYKNWTSLEFQLNGMQQEVNATQKAITNKKKNKEDADAELARKKELDAKIIEFKPNVAAAEQKMRTKARTIANIVGDKVPISQTEDDNLTLRTWLPDGPNASFEKRNDILSHHEVMYRLELFDTERGAKIAGHRGFYLTGCLLYTSDAADE